MPTTLQISSNKASLFSQITKIMLVVGAGILRYSVVLFLVLFGFAKWTHDEAVGIQPMMANSILTSWLYQFLSVQGASIAIGIVELVLAATIVSRRFFPKVSAWGSTVSIFMFLTTLSFLVTTPHLDPSSQGFLMKDLVLLGAAVYTAGEAFAAARMRNEELR